MTGLDAAADAVAASYEEWGVAAQVEPTAGRGRFAAQVIRIARRREDAVFDLRAAQRGEQLRGLAVDFAPSGLGEPDAAARGWVIEIGGIRRVIDQQPEYVGGGEFEVVIYTRPE